MCMYVRVPSAVVPAAPGTGRSSVLAACSKPAGIRAADPALWISRSQRSRRRRVGDRATRHPVAHSICLSTGRSAPHAGRRFPRRGPWLRRRTAPSLAAFPESVRPWFCETLGEHVRSSSVHELSARFLNQTGANYVCIITHELLTELPWS